MNGTVPAYLKNLTYLTTLRLQLNAFTAIDPDFTGILGLQSLSLQDNLLTGTLPVGLSTFTGLQHLTLQNNDLSGTMPPEWASLTYLTELDLSGNSLSGSLPVEWATMHSLTSFAINDQRATLVGSFPNAYANWTTLGFLCAPGYSFR